MTTQFVNPLSKFTTDDLKTLPYAVLYFYQNGSSTPKAVYADKNKVTSLGSSVTAYSNGTFRPIWLDGVYRVELKNAAGVTQANWPIDNVGDTYNYTSFSVWDSTFTYDTTTNTLVTGPDGLYYKSIQNPNLNKTPASNPSYWSQIYLTEVYNSTKNYAVNDIVTYSGKLYRSNTTPNTGNTPPASQWSDLTFNNNVVGDFTVTGNLRTGSASSGDKYAAVQLQEASNSGIYVGNTANSAKYALDWYEEGTFTPVVSGETTAGVGTYTNQYGVFTRIGNRVDISITLSWTAHTGTGVMKITGLPYTSSSLNTSTAIPYSSSVMTFGASKAGIVALFPNSTTIRPYGIDQTGVATPVQASLPASCLAFHFSMTYFV